jgi:hypothetical protein
MGFWLVIQPNAVLRKAIKVVLQCAFSNRNVSLSSALISARP